MTVKSSNLVWLDLEMTGLNPDVHRIIEIATVVTDNQLNVLAEGPVLSIHQPPEVMNLMDSWCVDTHTRSGLVERVHQSTVNEAKAEQLTMEFLANYVPAGKSPLCGNTICMDRRYLFRYMPKLESFFHYRLLDVSTLKILVMQWAPSLMKGFEKESEHVALKDIYESINELRYYREHVLKI